MSRLRCTARACLLVGVATVATAAVLAGSAQAMTFYVNERGATSTCLGRGIAACPKISEAISQAEKSSGPNTIEVEPETGGTTYNESINLLSSKDAGLTINGEEPGVVILGKGGPAVVAHLAGSVTLSNLAVRVGTTGLLKSAIADRLAALTLDNVSVENGSGEGLDGIEARELGSVTMNGGSVEMENGASGFAIDAVEAALALNGVKILNGGASEANAGGVYSEKSSLSAVNTQIAVESGASTIDFGISAGHDSSVSLQNVAVRQNSPAMGVDFEASPATVNGLRVEMVHGASSKVEAVLSEDEGASSTFSHLEVVYGTWTGPGLEAFGGDLTLTDSRVIESATSEAPALKYSGPSLSKGLLVQRSVLQAGNNAKPGALVAESGNVTLDSSEILGGKDGVFFEALTNATDALTVSASTVDASAPGTAADAAGVNGVEAVAKTAGSVAKVAIQGSIVLEAQSAAVGSGGQASIACSYSALPSQAQAASGGNGAIACANGSNGNSESDPISTLFSASPQFSEPLTSYMLSAFSSAVDSVPAGAISLPFGITPSTTDLAGSARILAATCLSPATQDRGALELPTHTFLCPPPPPVCPASTSACPPIPHPAPPAISGLKVSPNAFCAAPSGATISRVKRPKKKCGATVSYSDSQAATATFTVLKLEAGRMQGKACKKPGKKNKHGKRCTIYKTLGSFTHSDVAGADKFHFSGRVGGRKLAKGSYKLQAVPHNAAGSGAAAGTRFKIKG